MQQAEFGMTVMVNGRPVREYSLGSQTWIEGRYGSEYSFRVNNYSGQRVLAIPTVDGLSVMNGEAGSEMSGGYVIRPFGHAVVRGWRLDDVESGIFKFGMSQNSYAGKMGSADNIGVIGCMIIAENRPVVVHHQPVHVSHYDNPYTFGDVCRGGVSKGMGSSPRGMGTEMGAPILDQVTSVNFRRGQILTTMTIRYGDRETLERAGISLRYQAEVVHPESASAFPGGCRVPDDYPYRRRERNRY